MERWPKPEAENPCRANCDDHPSRSSLDYSTPLRSVRGNAITSPSPFYKLSSELSRESLRIPGAVPFMWEQSPGLRKFTTCIVPTPPHGPPKLALPISSTHTDLAKPSLANLFRQQNLECHSTVAGVSPSAAKSPLHPQIAQPPAMEHPRSSSARNSAVQWNIPASSIATKSTLHDKFADAASDSASDALTATAGDVSVDDSLMLSGPLRPASTPSEARDFIMHRFLPAAHTIACESPQTPSRRFLPPGISAGATPATPTPSCCDGSFRDYGGVINGARCKITNSLLYTSSSSIPAPRRQFLEGSFRSTLDDINDDSSEEEEEEPPSTPKACGIFPFRIQISLQTRHSTNRSRSKHHQHKDQQSHKKSTKTTSCSHTPKRIMDVLREDQSSSYEDESPVHQHRTRQYGDPCPRPPYSSDRYYKESSQLHQPVAMQRSLSDLNNEEASEYGSYYDAPSRFCSPSPAALHLVNARASRTSMLSSLVANEKSTKLVGLIDGIPHPAIISTTEQHLLNSSLCYYNMHTAPYNKPHPHHPQLASPCSCLTPPPSHMSSSQDSSLNNDHITKVANTETWDALSHVHHTEQRTHIVNNALYEHEDQQPNDMRDGNHTSMLASQVGAFSTNVSTRVNDGSESRAGDAKWHANANGNVNESKSAQNLSNGDDGVVSICDHDVRDCNKHGEIYVNNGNGGQHEYKGDTHNVSNGELYAWNAMRYACSGIHYVGNGDLHACHGAHYVCNNNHTVGGIHGFSSRLLSPPLPKSPTHSWLDKAMPLVASAANNSPSTSSRLSFVHNKATLPAAAERGPLKGKQASSPAADSKWEALVKGSHLQPGHLRFSKELFEQSQTLVSGAS